MIGTGLLAGVIAGLLGVGGGMVIVPALEYLLRFVEVPPAWRMHVAVATSLATIVPTSIASSRAHHRRGAIDLDLVRSWAGGMLAGGFAGSLFASRAPSGLLSGIFGCVAAAAALRMALPSQGRLLAPAPPRGVRGGALATLIGALSALLGIGGGTFSVPVMALTGQPIHRAVGTAAVFGLLISLPGTVGYLLAEPPVHLPWGTVGWVSLTGVALIAPATVVTAPLGARLAHGLSRRTLSIVFAGFLLIVAARMLHRTFAP
ncbi:MAG: sulfite exporter TauE/SafE family protein [Gammaproteobacteria bacterium]|nr:sulfite exporter TauE/SafE family protein [Gammaproteobacteria bacterium]